MRLAIFEQALEAIPKASAQRYPMHIEGQGDASF